MLRLAGRGFTVGLFARLLMLLIRGYQLTLSKAIRMLFGNVCRFTPSCSSYAYECVRMHGALRGCLLSAKRLGKCHPFHPGGHDPPPRPKSDASMTELSDPELPQPK